MKKNIALSLSFITIIICGWIIVNGLQFLDIPSNKNEWYAKDAKNKINERSDIDECEKKILTNKIDQERTQKKYISEIAIQTQMISFVIIIIQLLLLLFIFLIPKKI